MKPTDLFAVLSGIVLVIVWQRPVLSAEVAENDPIPGFQIGPPIDHIVPGELLVDPPTLENLGFRWYIAGDSNRNASVKVEYRREGETVWRDALPMLRVRHEVANQDYEPYRTGNLFAGSVMFLEPGTPYEVRLTMDDPDGGAPPPKTLAVATRNVPEVPSDAPTRHVYTAEYQGPLPKGAILGLQNALKAARPGEILLLQAGVHRGPFSAQPKGTADRPIVLRAAGDGEVILEGTGHDADLLDLNGAEYVYLEGLTLRHARTAIRAGKRGEPGAVGLVVRRCKIRDVVTGIFSYSENSRDWYLADNELEGINPTWYPRPGDNKYMEPAHTGVNIYGRGHVVCYNRIARFSDALAIANFGVPVEDLRRHCVAIDFYGNDLSFAQDDCLETDYGC
ncbi:MAG TPA: chondroitinase-B domain-containing protein, partial [Thermoguttaceae bacterium]|nr:chondroitinase-B domain-containing protein [Thermoguttaceae bacterium]